MPPLDAAPLDRAALLEAVKKNALALQEASTELRGDREVVMAAIAQTGLALQFVTAEGLRAVAAACLLAEVGQLLLSDDARVAKPAAIWSYTTGSRVDFLPSRPCFHHIFATNNLALFVANRFATFVHV